MSRQLRTLPERREAVEDRREKPGAGYTPIQSADPDNRRISIRRDWKRRDLPRYPKLTDPMHPDEERELEDFLKGFE